jgi:hypothetical protein
MSYLKKHWCWMLPVVIVACIIVGAFTVIRANQPTEPVVVYRLPERSPKRAAPLNAGGLPKSTSAEPTAAKVMKANEDQEDQLQSKESIEEFPSERIEELRQGDNIARVRHKIATLREDSDTDASKPQSPQILRDIWKSAGLSETALKQTMTLFLFNPDISLDQVDDLLANLQSVGNAIDHYLREDAGTLTLDEARTLVEYLKDDPTATAEQYRYITRELITPEIQAALTQEGALF